MKTFFRESRINRFNIVDKRKEIDLNLNKFEFIEVLKHIMIENHTNVDSVCLVYFKNFTLLSYDEWKKNIEEVLILENEFHFGTMNLISFFYAYLRIDLLSLIYSDEININSASKEHILDWFIYSPLSVLSVRQYHENLEAYNISDEEMIICRDKLLNEGAKNVSS